MSARRWLRRLVRAAFVIVVLSGTVHLTRWPVTWFDEGIHLHVPKALVRFGAYADYSSEGLRHFGPTLAVGPTVMLPIAASFATFGVGLLQARLVMAAYLAACLAAFFLLGRRLGGPIVGLVAGALLLSSPGPATLEYGRQVLGEVPGAAFLACGLLVWFRAWSRPTTASLVAAGLLLGLATVTKHVYLLALGPALLLSWGLNAVYYRTLPARVFLVPGAICAVLFGVWQWTVLAWLSPGSVAENWALLRQTSAGAAFVFDPALVRQSFLELLGLRGYLGLLVPALAYTAWRARRRTRQEQMWSVVWLVAMANLSWFVLASNGWLRYAFVGLATSALLVARFWRDLLRAARTGDARPGRQASALGVALGVWLAFAAGAPMANTAAKLVAVPPADAAGVAVWLTTHVPLDTVIETWEPELGLLTDHRFHYPPPSLLIHAVAHVVRGGSSPATQYTFRGGGAPAFVVVGPFARWVGLYSDPELRADYRPRHQQGPYVVWEQVVPADRASAVGR
ncbi:MAG: glycosyltransferase family 39 protein [Acidobacteria bacterium]|nr:glycosyltransferase family 39 protein [Acidobacteriota bacterium]